MLWLAVECFFIVKPKQTKHDWTNMLGQHEWYCWFFVCILLYQTLICCHHHCCVEWNSLWKANQWKIICLIFCQSMHKMIFHKHSLWGGFFWVWGGRTFYHFEVSLFVSVCCFEWPKQQNQFYASKPSMDSQLMISSNEKPMDNHFEILSGCNATLNNSSLMMSILFVIIS